MILDAGTIRCDGVFMTDRLAELGAEFRRLRSEAARLKQRSSSVRRRTAEIRPLLAIEIAKSTLSGAEIVRLTGYDRDSVRKIRIAVESRRTGHDRPIESSNA